jgi:hypothetical protein
MQAKHQRCYTYNYDYANNHYNTTRYIALGQS